MIESVVRDPAAIDECGKGDKRMADRPGRKRWGWRRLGRLTLFALGAIAVLALVASVSILPAKTFQVVDDGGRGVPDAVVVYHYHGYRFNPVCTSTYDRPGSIVHADAEGRFRIPASVHWHQPSPLEEGPELTLDLVYSPRLHATLGTIEARSDRVPGRLDWEQGLLTLADHTDDPAAWDRSLSWLLYVVGDVVQDLPAGLDASPDDKRRLVEATAADLDAFVARHATTPRAVIPPPETWDAERRAESVHNQEENLAHEPFWGPYEERMWRDDVRYLAREPGK